MATTLRMNASKLSRTRESFSFSKDAISGTRMNSFTLEKMLSIVSLLAERIIRLRKL